MSTGLVRIGVLDVPADSVAWHRLCVTPGTAQLAFPMRSIRTVLAGTPSHEGDRVITPLHVMCVDGRWDYRRSLVDPRGERSGIIEYDDELVRQAAERIDPHGMRAGRSMFRDGVVPIDAGLFAQQRRLVRGSLDGADPAEIESHALAILDDVIRQGARHHRPRTPRVSTREAHADVARGALEYLERQACNRVTLTEVGRAVHLSPGHAARVFRAYTGITIGDAIMQIRLRRAYDQLRDTRDPIWRIALQNGFADLAHLSNAFRRAFGTAPSRERG